MPYTPTPVLLLTSRTTKSPSRPDRSMSITIRRRLARGIPANETKDDRTGSVREEARRGGRRGGVDGVPLPLLLYMLSGVAAAGHQ